MGVVAQMYERRDCPAQATWTGGLRAYDEQSIAQPLHDCRLSAIFDLAMRIREENALNSEK